ncbi:hypothetical protein Tco_0880133, partial [Tanacetum coccineum]
RMVALVNSRRKELAEQRAQKQRDRPITPSQLRQYMHTYLQEEFDKIQRVVAFTRGLKRDGSLMTHVSSKKLKTGDVVVDVEALSHGVPQEEESVTPSRNVSREEVAAPPHSPNIQSLQFEKVGTKKKRLGRKGVHTSQSTIPIKEGDPEAEHKVCIKYASNADSASDDDTPVNLYAVVDWEFCLRGIRKLGVALVPLGRSYVSGLKDVVGNDMTTAEQLIRFIKNQLAAAQVSPA